MDRVCLQIQTRWRLLKCPEAKDKLEVMFPADGTVLCTLHKDDRTVDILRCHSSFEFADEAGHTF